MICTFKEIKYPKLSIVIVITTILSCKAQSIIIPIISNENFDNTPNYYIKDVTNEFEKFEGTWKYTNDNTELVFKLKKETRYQIDSNSNFEDLLVGEYKYIENSIEKVNTLINFNNMSITGYDHKISGGIFLYRLPSYCNVDNSTPQEIKIELFISDPSDDLIEGRIILRYVNTNGTEKLEVCLYDYTSLADDVNARFPIPDGFYEFVKQ